MGHKNALERYIHIDYCLCYKYYTLDQITDFVNGKLIDNGLKAVSKRTIRKDIADIQLLFGKEINKGKWFTDDKVHYRYDSDEKYIFTRNA